ncbi:ribonuclease J [Rickettsiales endosymbiont of Stachyamoeba lipophora]|uniref:ribonuclease J n=1 Tax=Rickettsiales endosymbiont of Stachyamoeba lipophora TaxID=2486578 RepID=UPI000F64BAB4|nr:ribonuclease J [Rickettsiales endosymbiont of Stachyamoeba lipophora]AZL15992.1 ribonuclease J [Rickettsiales endosymbiont of Stachyamoeba lipophora]
MTLNFNKHKNDLIFVPLGGSGEIGLNLNLYQYQGKWLMVDLGCGFADDYLPGVDVIVPDISFITKHRENLLGIVITHSHEDHLGAVQYLWHELRVPVYATPFTSSFLKAKLTDSFGDNAGVLIKEFQPDSSLELGPFKIQSVSLNHSSPEMQALFIKTEAGNIFHTGDWKFDHDPIVGLPNNDEVLKSIGDQGVLAMVCDSTNVFNEEYSGSEGDLRESLVKLVAECKNLVTITTFASNLARVETVLYAAQQAGRKVVIAGKSLWRIIQAATDSGYFKEMPEFIDERNIGQYPKKEILLLCTGCQGEQFAAATKIANNAHPNIKFSPGDTIIFSSKIIPGNDKKIFRLFNLFVKMGVEVLTERDHFVHVSGHPGRKELKKMYELIRPQVAVPVHGELTHMHYHAKFAREIGIKQALEVENGDVLHLSATDKSMKLGVVEAGYLGVDGLYLLPPKSPIMQARRKMRASGCVFVSIILSPQKGLLCNPILKTPGVLDQIEDKALVNEMIDEIREAVESKLEFKAGRINREDLNNTTRSIVRKIIKRETNKEPMVECHIEIM